ncbi:adhesion G-protein coupled receptor G2 [Astyanax mexicanus]|uniref:adhesion G-protein coupled receptor G2 n=1 Tax=Astyanax mexicanus TaxID=7994 RepID=UPI0020CB2D59|nr:adhesion G-protein coupled receptor G2 [Astyanax mexicanus]
MYNSDNTKNVMRDLPKAAKSICDACTLPITTDGAKGIVVKNAKNESVKIGYDDNWDVVVVADTSQESKWSVTVPEEAFSMARMQMNETPFVGVVRFQDLVESIIDNDSTLYFKSDVFGISMEANITNLTNSIDIYFRKLSMPAANWTCMSSDSADTWTSSGCKTNFINNTIQCSCTHLTFFALLMSQPNQVISEVDVVSLTYITSIGCGLSTFFLIVGLFIHFVMRRAKIRVGTTILMHLFVALVLLNITFLSNQQVTNLNNSVSCVIIAAATHFSMLATFTWFFVQALHFYLSLNAINTTKRQYKLSVIGLGWGFPAVVVIVIAATGNYEQIKSYQMCWLTNTYIHYIVNVGYYALIFIFTCAIFIVIVQKITHTRLTKHGIIKTSSKRTGMIFSLFVLLGLTWGVAFFSYGPMLIPSYYIFSILNSFQGFFLFLYYYFFRNEDVDMGQSDSSLKKTNDTNTTTSTIEEKEK